MTEELIQHYNIPVPRYTSYPPATLFSPQYTESDYLADVMESNHSGSHDLSFYIHIPYCRNLCLYCGCNRIPHMPPLQDLERYISAIKLEIDRISDLLDPDRQITQIHFGGGSSTSIPFHYLSEIINHLLGRFSLRPNHEIAIECHPGFIDREGWQELVEMPFTRYSIGVQDFETEVLHACKRVPAQVDLGEVITEIHKFGKGVNLDFIYGLPLQTPDSFEQTIQYALSLSPDRIVTFSYAHVPWIHPAQKKLEEIGLPTVKDKGEMYERASRLAENEGCLSLGLDHFVKPTDSLGIALQNHNLHRNFQGYCSKDIAAQVYGLGITGIAQLHNAYAQNFKTLPEYYAALDEGHLPIAIGYRLSHEEQIARDIITELMCNYRVDLTTLWTKDQIPYTKWADLPYVRMDALEQMARDGLCDLNEHSLEMMSDAHFFVRNVASTFDIHYDPQNPKGYSKPI